MEWNRMGEGGWDLTNPQQQKSSVQCRYEKKPNSTTKDTKSQQPRQVTKIQPRTGWGLAFHSNNNNNQVLSLVPRQAGPKRMRTPRANPTQDTKVQQPATTTTKVRT